MLRRYWFIFYPEDRYGPRNYGVTSYSQTAAKQLLLKALCKLDILTNIAALNDQTEVIEDIDTRLLDQGHVMPNIGVVTFEGVWFPNLSLR